MANLKDVLSFDYLLSATFIRKSFLDYKQGQHNIFSSKAIINYFRRIFTDDILGGVVVKKTVDELLYGYTDPFLKQMSTTSYLNGGDPTINPVFSFLNPQTQPNEDQWSFYTGSDDLDKLRQYKTVSGASSSYILYEEF